MTTGMSPSAVHHCGDERDEVIEDRPQQQPPNRPSRATIRPHRGGYDCEFVKPPSVDFPQTDCPVCLLVLREPHQASCCGTSYCEACVKRVKEDKKCCPTCNEADFTIFPDKRLKRSLYALNVYCCQRRGGCEWEGELGELERHLNLQPPPEKLLVGCQFAEVDCTYCIQPFKRRFFQAHQSDDCSKRPYSCKHCNKYVATFEEVTQNHWLMCPFFPLSCPNNCELVLQRQEMEHHLSQNCPLTLVQCDFHVVGCQMQLTKKDMPSHISENLTRHMSLLQAHMMLHPGENMATYLWLMVGSVQKLAMENVNVHSELHEAQQQLRESKERVAQLEAKVAAQNEKIAAHQQTLEKVTYTGTLPFEFTMNEFEQHKMACDEWHSPPFYTHTHGYKICIKLCANGLKSANGTHVSVHGCLMCGEFDDDLQWPFQGSITIQLLNQLEDGNHHTRTINFASTGDPNVISRVTSGKRAGSGSGWDTFISHAQLNLNTVKNSQFLKNNQLKFRVFIATNLDPTASIHRRCLTLESFVDAVEPQVCVAPIEFTLSSFERQKKQNDVWYSPAFYTHSQGYRMCVKVNANGCGDGLGTHVSIFTCIMQGPFDGGLKWPLQGNITIQIVNQAGEDNHHMKIINYTDKTPDSHAGKMTEGRSRAWGKRQFLSHDLLGYNAASNTQYLRGDSLRIRIFKVELKI